MSKQAPPRSYDDFRKDPFFNVPNRMTKTSVSPVVLPMLFNTTRVRHLNYFIDPERVDPLLKGTGLIPCRFFNGKCLLSFIFYNYQDVTIGAYDEVTITVLVRPEMLPDPKIYLPSIFKKKGINWNGIGAYVIEMPVTIPQARAAGRELWGFPKFQTKIPFKLQGNRFEFGVKDPETDEWIVEVKGSHTAGIRMTGTDLVTFSNFRGKIWKTIIDTNVKYKNCFVKDLEVRVGKSSHGMTENIKALGLETAKPFIMWTSDNLRSRLNHGEAIADFPTPLLSYQPEGGDGEAEGVTL
ncbi:Acetoacetate decarboxylase (ADC) [Desulfatibacillum alkenivorans DSM 16219]|uniref:Acetoacetate decarboxylase (ADC) n=1 Tax=Desulfatibacillum alkenivorans DSM 16219 TaxID=1121393 RepID=A0A1M6MNF0_9BACT|nr:acetoacetate decarboxylase family protein [Desulfatibacillum alkenivorans]SHJ85011.1 Acetoacetate decarboxylase (ADC) [Desulfatibacillum alkenivorans DSM 16219]